MVRPLLAYIDDHFTVRRNVQVARHLLNFMD
jgi:hypothetical protein